MASGSTEIDTDLRLLLIGRTGHGKSETGNSLLGYKAFPAKRGTTSTTSECGWKIAEKDGKRIEIVDTPGLMDTEMNDADIKTELNRALLFSSPGIHAIALVMKLDKFTPEMKQVVDLFFDFFGNGVEKHAFVIFTFIDTQFELMDGLDIIDEGSKWPTDTNPDDFIVGNEFKAALAKNGHNVDGTLKQLIDRCGGNAAIINNKTKNEEQKQQQVNAILNEINKIKIRTGNTHFHNEDFHSVDLMVEIEVKKAKQAKEQGKEHVPWSWLRAKDENTKTIMIKLLEAKRSDDENKERQEKDAENRKRQEKEDAENRKRQEKEDAENRKRQEKEDAEKREREEFERKKIEWQREHEEWEKKQSEYKANIEQEKEQWKQAFEEKREQELKKIEKGRREFEDKMMKTMKSQQLKINEQTQQQFKVLYDMLKKEQKTKRNPVVA